MAWNLDFMDTYLRYNPAEAASLGKWNSISGSGTWTADDGQQALVCSQLSKTIPGSTRGRIVGVRCKTPADPGGGVVFNIVTLRDQASGNPLRLDYLPASGFLRLFRPGGGFFDSTDPTGHIANQVEANFEVALWFDGALAHYEVKVDGVTVVDMVGTQAVSGTSMQMERIAFGDGPTSSAGKYSWFWTKTWNTVGGIWGSSDFYGNVLRGHEAPDDDGQYPAVQPGARWLPNSGVKYFSRLNEAQADSTTYASNIVDPNPPGAGAVDRMSVQHSDPPTTLVNVKAVQAVCVAKMQSGTGTARLFYGVTGSAGDTFDPTSFSPSSSYQYVTRPLITDPRDGAAWSRAKLVNLDIGVELVDLV